MMHLDDDHLSPTRRLLGSLSVRSARCGPGWLAAPRGRVVGQHHLCGRCVAWSKPRPGAPRKMPLTTPFCRYLSSARRRGGAQSGRPGPVRSRSSAFGILEVAAAAGRARMP
eukprot:scaffold3068_cov401-Prasinococcus_capsulatus_cf.AAC.53